MQGHEYDLLVELKSCVLLFSLQKIPPFCSYLPTMYFKINDFVYRYFQIKQYAYNYNTV
jgi:hypothetical protein